MSRLGRRLLLVTAGCLSVATIGASLWVFHQIETPYQGYQGPNELVTVERGSTLRQVAQTLEAHGIVRSAVLFQWYLRLLLEPSALKAGEYLFEGAMNLPAVTDKLVRGLVHHYRITIPEGLDLQQTAERLSAQGFGTQEILLEVMRQPELSRDWASPSAENLEGYLFPDTYFFTRNMSEEQIVQTMVENFGNVWTERRMLRLQELEMSIHEVVTLASLVEKETGLAQERPLVSAVFHNRLRHDIKLACDPTVIYAVKRIKEFDGIIHRSDLELDSPYNTYIYPGLPPGPIANPGLAAIDAALFPAEVGYLYFVSTNDGAHVFSTNYRDHNRAVNRYQR